MKYDGIHGGTVNALYTPQEIDEYAGNPLIEALPEILSDDDVINRLFMLPPISKKDREKPAKIRMHIIQRIRRCMIPWGRHLKFEGNISVMLRQGYITRNPLDTMSLQNHLSLISEQDPGDIESIISLNNSLGIQSTALTTSLIGISGIGKTTAVESLLRMYPQVIRHEQYKGTNLENFIQIVWLKVDCPFDGSLKTFCQSFFKAIDDALESESNYYYKFGNANNSRGKMMIDMQRLAAIHSIGIIAIDEMQHLTKTKDPDELLNFLVSLENKIGVPIILIGTYKAIPLLSKDLKIGRRVTTQSSVFWEELSFGDEWEWFMSSIWEMQCLKEHTPFSQEFSELMYHESQGIVAIASNLFLLSQINAIYNSEEHITKKVIKETSKNDLYMVKKLVTAIRDKDKRAMAKYEDLTMDIDSVIQNKGEDIDVINRIKEYANNAAVRRENQNRTKVEILSIELAEMGIFTNLSANDIETIATETVKALGVTTDESTLKKDAVQAAIKLDNEKAEKKEKAKQKITKKVSNEGLIYLYHKALKGKRHMYDVLMETGYIKEMKEYTQY